MKNKRDYEERIARAITNVREGLSIRAAAEKYNIVPSTLSRRIEGTQSHQRGAEHLQRLHPEQEEKVVNWIAEQEALGKHPDRSTIVSFAQSILAAEGIEKPLGARWIDRFLRRHKEVKSKVGRRVDADRMHPGREEEIREFYPYLAAVRKQYNILPSNEYNWDETGLQEGETNQATVFGVTEGTRTRVAKSTATSWVTFLEYVSRLGHRGTPVVIFKGKKVQAQWFGQKVVEWEYTATPSGWTNNIIAKRWMKEVFLVETKPRYHDQYRLLILDGHPSHTTPEFMWMAYTNKVVLVYLPAHSSDQLQPLDVGVFLPLKTYFRQEMRLWASYLATAPVYKQRMLQAYVKASTKAFSTSNILAGWRESGLWPLDPSKVLTKRRSKREQKMKQLVPGTPPHQPPKNVWETPKGPGDIAKQLKEIEKKNVALNRDIRNLVTKAEKGFALHTATIATLKAANEDLRLQLDQYAPDIRQNVEPNPNKIFASLPQIRDAQSKREKRLPDGPLPDDVIEDCITVNTDPPMRKRIKSE